MATPVMMPRQGQSVESCIIAKWHKKKGDKVEIGDILFSYETDKASFDEEAKVAGVMLDCFFKEGDDVPCLHNVCVIGDEGESTAKFSPAAAGVEPAAVSSSGTAGTTEQQNQQNPKQTQITDSESIKISPRAKKMAEKVGVDCRYASPSGPYGRIITRDIEALREAGLVFTASARAEQLQGNAGAVVAGTGLGGRITTGDLSGGGAAAGTGLGGRITTGDLSGGGAAAAADVILAGAVSGTASALPGGAATPGGAALPGGASESLYEEIKLPNIRKIIAKTMHQSLSSMAQLTLNSSFDMTDILEFRKKLKESKDRLGLENITINDIIIYVVSRTLAKHRELNAHFLDDRMLCFKNVNMGIAVDTGRGLMVPTLFNADLKSLNEISAEVKKLAKDCQEGTINPDMLKGGSFTITNLGTLDIESFTPVINPPQTGILGVNNIVQRAREADGEFRFYPAMGLSLTFDHRAIDGAPAARFLKDLKTGLESFSTMLVK